MVWVTKKDGGTDDYSLALHAISVDIPLFSKNFCISKEGTLSRK